MTWDAGVIGQADQPLCWVLAAQGVLFMDPASESCLVFGVQQRQASG